MSPCSTAGRRDLRNPASRPPRGAAQRAEKVLHFSGTERKVYKSNSCVARRWPVLHLANEKSVPFDVAPTRAWWESLLYRPLLHPSPFTERTPFPPLPPSLPPGVSLAVLPSSVLRDRTLFLHSQRYIFYIGHFTNSQKMGLCTKILIELDLLIVFESSSI